MYNGVTYRSECNGVRVHGLNIDKVKYNLFIIPGTADGKFLFEQGLSDY